MINSHKFNYLILSAYNIKSNILSKCSNISANKSLLNNLLISIYALICFNTLTLNSNMSNVFDNNLNL